MKEYSLIGLTVLLLLVGVQADSHTDDKCTNGAWDFAKVKADSDFDPEKVRIR